MVFFETILFIAIMIAPPITFMLLNGHFVGRKAASPLIAGLFVFVVFCLLSVPVLQFVLARLRSGTALDFVWGALVVGAAIAAIIGMQEVKRSD